MSHTKEIQELSLKRFIPIAILFVFGIIAILSGYAKKETLLPVIKFFENEYVNPVIWLICIIIGLGHKIYVTQNWISSMSSTVSYAAIITSSVYITVGLLNQWINEIQFLTDPNNIEQVSLGLAVLVLLNYCIGELYEMVLKTFYVTKQRSVEKIKSPKDQ